MKLKKLNRPILRVFIIFLISFFLLVTLLTSFVLIPEIDKIIEEKYGEDGEVKLVLEADLLKRFIESHRKILQDFSNFPVITNTVLHVSPEDPNFIDLVDNFSISGGKPRLVLHDVVGDVIYQTSRDFMGSYGADQDWMNTLLNGESSYHFQLLGQVQDQFIFALSIPVKYGVNIEGILSAEITAPLKEIFSPSIVEENGAIRLTQDNVIAQTEVHHILAPHEFSTKLIEAGLVLTYISDDAAVLSAKNKLSNTILYTLFAGLAISFLLFVFFGYRTLAGSHGARSTHKKSFSKVYFIPIVVGFIGVAMAIAAHMVSKNLQEQEIKLTMLSDANGQIRAVKEAVLSNLQVLNALKAFYDASTFVDRDEFSIFARSLLEYNVDIQALEWVPKVIHSERNRYEAQARADGLPHFNITERQQSLMVSVATREFYFPVYYVEPFQGNEAAMGFDLASNAQRLAALLVARDQGKPVATAPIVLVQEDKRTQAGLLIVKPVYVGVSHYDDRKERQRHLKGFVLVVLRIGDMINRVLGETNQNIDLHVEDITDVPESIFGALKPPSLSSQEIFSSSVLDVAGRQWQLTAVSHLDAYKAQQTLLPWLVLIGGFIFNVFVVFSLIHHIRRRQVIEDIVGERTQEIQEIKHFQDLIMANIPDLLFVRDDAYRIVQTNPAFLNIYPKEKRAGVIGATSIVGYDDEQAQHFLQSHEQALQSGYSETEEMINFPNGKTGVLFTKRVRIEDMQGNRFVLGLARDITDIKQAEAALQESEKRYEVSVRGSAIGLWDWNVKTDELFWSDRFKEIVGISSQVFNPQLDTFVERLHPEDKEKTMNALLEHIQNKIPYDVEYRLRHVDNSYIWIHARGQAVWDEQDNATRMAGTVDDISVKKKAEEEILRSNIELERFAYVASHDLQEPLRMVDSFTNLLEKQYAADLDDRAKKYIAFARGGAQRMQMLIKDLLEYARIGQEAERYEKVDVNNILSLVQENLKESIDDSNTQITHDGLPIIFTNPVRFMRLLQNLIGNAIKYQNSERHPEIHVSASKKNELWLFSVKDNGIGMHQKYCEKIFEPFKRLHKKDEYTGVGMGLAICRKIVEGFGGTIYVDSVLGEGSTFYFTIPIQEENDRVLTK